MEELIKYLKPLKRKMMIHRAITILMGCLSCGFLVCTVIVALGKYRYIQGISRYIFAVMVMAAIVSAIVIYRKKPQLLSVAKEGDRLGYKERFQTAVEIGGQKNPIAKMVVQDAVNQAKEADFKKLYKIRFNKKTGYFFWASMSVLLIAGFVKSPVPEKIEQEYLLQQKIAEQVEKLETQKQALLREAEYKERIEIERITKDLTQSLKSAKSEGDMLKAGNKAREALTRLATGTIHEDLKKLGGSLKQHELTRELGMALEKGNTNTITQEIQQLNRWLEKATEEQKEFLAQILREAAKEIREDSELKEKINELSDALSDGGLGEYGDAMREMNQILNNLAKDHENLREAIQDYKEALSDVSEGGQMTDEMSINGEEGAADAQPMMGQIGGETLDDGASTNQSMKGSDESGHEDNPGDEHVENENIYSRDANIMSDENVNIQGEILEGGFIQTQRQKDLGSAGKSIPYERVFQEYKEDALNQLEDFDIPYGMQEIVKAYFTNLE